MVGVFETHEQTKDRQEFIENLTIIYNKRYVEAFKDLLRQNIPASAQAEVINKIDFSIRGMCVFTFLFTSPLRHRTSSL